MAPYVEDALAMQNPAPDDALVVGPSVKPEKKAAQFGVGLR
jgi:hypothetical protein